MTPISPVEVQKINAHLPDKLITALNKILIQRFRDGATSIQITYHELCDAIRQEYYGLMGATMEDEHHEKAFLNIRIAYSEWRVEDDKEQKYFTFYYPENLLP
jgi:hypothetical protein